ncbi:MAG TPA: DUF2252 family protein, partial [Vicinamibacterales bacterium]|nr:DUF2252 family protein [Vicinamibacterales bacterium]
MTSNALRSALCLAVAIGSVLIGPASASSQLQPERGAIEFASGELLDRLRADPFAYFRFVNRSWTSRVCEVFADEMRDLPIANLHGDAHVEQFAVTNDAWGLDDFDDSNRGPALVDIVRFLGSIDLAVRQRGWPPGREALFDRFFEGYQKGLAEPDVGSPQPGIVDHLREQAPRSRAAFLEWGEMKMEPMSEASARAVVAGMEAISRSVYAQQSDLPPGYFAVARAGWLRLGVGSAVSPKILIRVQGPSPAPEDDELVEAKQVQSLSGLPCLEVPPADQPTLRVILGSRQLGRLKPTILAASPELVIPEDLARGRQLRDWWIRSWDPSY